MKRLTELSINRPISRGTLPPFEEWEALLSAFAIIEEVGPRFDTGKLLQRLEDNLFDGLRIRAAPDGHALSRLEGSGQLRKELLKKIPVGSHNALEAVSGFRKLIATRAKLTWTHPSTVHPSAKFLIEKELVYIRTDTSIEHVTRKPTRHLYAQVSRDWARFFVELNALETKVTESILHCLREGRAICVYQDGPGSALQVPGYWEGRTSLGGHAKATFLLTSDLPNAWHQKRMSGQEIKDRQKKAEAMRWLYAQYQLPERPDDLRNKDAALGMLETKFGIRTPKVRIEVWEETPISNWRFRGRPKKS